MKTYKRSFFYKSTIATAVCASFAGQMAGGSVYAQEANEDALDEVETILVFARKRGEVAEEVPVSISAMSASELSSAGIQDITALFAQMPSVETNGDGSRIAYKPAIRGVGSQENAAIRAKVTSFIDGVPFVGAQGISSFAGLQQVEVLRGPQSAAFGRSTFGGAINYVTKDPDTLGDFEFDASATIGTDSLQNFGLVMSTPLIEDKLAAAVTLESKSFGGPSEWKTTSGDQLGGTSDMMATVKLKYTPTENISAEVFYLKQDIDDDHYAVQVANLDQQVPHPLDSDGTCAVNGGTNSCVINGKIDSIPLVWDHNFDLAANPILDPGTRITRERLQGSLDIGFDNDMTLTILAAYTDEEGETWFDRDASPTGYQIHASSSPVIDESYGEIRLASGTNSSFNWLVGASIYQYDYVNTVYSNLTNNVVMDIFAEEARNMGIFFSLGYDINEDLTASLEGRFQSDEITSGYAANAARNAPNDITSKNTTDSFQPRFALTYALDDVNNLFFQASRGTNPAGFNTNALDPILLETAASENYPLDVFQTYEEEVMTNFEIGAKGRSQEHNFNYSASIYYLQWEGYVVPVTGNWTPDDGVLLDGTTGNDYFSRLFLNTGDLDGFGAEFEGNWQPTDSLDLGIALAYTGLEFVDDACSPIPLDYGVPADRTDPFACSFSVAGNTPPMVSKYTGSINATYTRELQNGMSAYVRGDYQYRSKRFIEQTNFGYVDAYSTVNLRFGVKADEWSVELFANNLLDDDTPAGGVRFFDNRQSGMSFNSTVNPRLPRIVGINLRYSFY